MNDQTAPPYLRPPGKKPRAWVWVSIGLLCLCCPCSLVLSAILFPVFLQARVSARSALSISDAKQVAIATLMYTADHNDRMPTFLTGDGVAKDLYPAYLKTEPLRQIASGYDWNLALSAQNLDEVDHPESTWMFHSSAPDGRGNYYVGFVDARIARESDSQLRNVTSVKTRFDKGSQ
jgi:hypothetical protein